MRIPDPPIDPDPPALEIVHNSAQTIRRAGQKIGRNDQCPCGSGRKFKHCCLAKTSPPALSACVESLP